MDISITEGRDGKPLAHRPDCPEVADARAQGGMVLTMFECAVGVDDLECSKHGCLAQASEGAR
jgi:hypothetical protein